VTSLRVLESPLAAWRSFRDIARATRTLAAAQSMMWADRCRHADAHLAWCEAVALQHARPRSQPRPRVAVAIGSDLGLCGPLNRFVAERCVAEDLDAAPTILRVVVGARLAALEPLTGAILLPTPSSMPAVARLAGAIEQLLDRLPDPLELELTMVLASAVEGDGHPRIDVRRSASPDVEPTSLSADAREVLARTEQPIADDPELVRAARLLTRHARIVAALSRAVQSENEARWRTMGRAHESALRRIAEQESRLRKLRQEQITQEMLEARQGAGRPPIA
jgi:hypothetical protein